MDRFGVPIRLLIWKIDRLKQEGWMKTRVASTCVRGHFSVLPDSRIASILSMSKP